MNFAGFGDARKLERLELHILLELRKASPGTDRAFPVSLQQWGLRKWDVNGIYATNRGEFFFMDYDSERLTVMLLDTRRALDLISLMGCMGVAGNKSCLSELVYSEAELPMLGLPPPPKKKKKPKRTDPEPEK